MTRHIEASHLATSVRDEINRAADEAWKRADAAAKPKRAAPPPPVKKKSPPPPKPPTPRRSATKPLPVGSLVLSPAEVEVLDELLATHPALKNKDD